MAVDKPKLDPGVLELLYPDELGELDQAEVRALRDEAELSSHNARDLKAFDAMLARIRAEDLPGEEVRPSVHNAIMDAARAHRESAAAAPTPTPVPKADRPPGPIAPKPIWARIPMNTARQFALAASVLLVAGVFFVMMRPSPEQKFTSANSKITADVDFGGSPPSPTAAPPAQVAKAESVAPGPAGEDHERDDSQQPAADAAQAEQAPMELALNTGAEPTPPPGPPQSEGMASSPYGGRATPRSRSSRRIPTLDESREQKENAAAKRKVRAPAKAQKPSRTAGTIDLWDKDSAPAPARAPMPDSPAESMADAPQPAEAQFDEAEQAPAPPKAPSKMDAIAESFASAHYDETIARADLLAQNPNTPDADIAQAREFKARAQEASGNPSGALDTYQLIQARHPTFKTSVIAAHIRRLDQQLNAEPMRRERAAPMNAIDSMQMDSASDD